MEKIYSPTIGTIVTHMKKVRDDNKFDVDPYDVYIVEGKFESQGRISNYWYWKRILPDGTLGKMEHGYGSFAESKNLYEITINVKKT